MGVYCVVTSVYSMDTDSFSSGALESREYNTCTSGLEGIVEVGVSHVVHHPGHGRLHARVAYISLT